MVSAAKQRVKHLRESCIAAEKTAAKLERSFHLLAHCVDKVENQIGCLSGQRNESITSKL